jgi:hypothetical protein
MIMIKTAVFIGLTNGNCLALTLSAEHPYQYDEIDPVYLFGDIALQEVDEQIDPRGFVGWAI